MKEGVGYSLNIFAATGISRVLGEVLRGAGMLVSCHLLLLLFSCSLSSCFGVVSDEGSLGCLDGLNTMVEVGWE